MGPKDPWGIDLMSCQDIFPKMSLFNSVIMGCESVSSMEILLVSNLLMVESKVFNCDSNS